MSYRNRHRKAVIVGAVSAAILIAVGIILWKRRHTSLYYQAQSYIYALWNGDMDTVYEYTFEGERKRGVTKQAMRDMWSLFLQPIFKTYRIVGYDVFETQAQCVYTLHLKRPSDGHISQIDANLWATDVGGRATFVGRMHWVWYERYGQGSYAVSDRSNIRGVLHDRAQLEAIGLNGITYFEAFPPSLFFKTWDERLAIDRNRLERDTAEGR